ncbi:MAG: peptide ABC transporter substrate-binding protein [Chloroflexi bacterium]|nr:peptide ABC transporter substrate-binding protein [Chloroflexota bacterium]
MKRTIAILMLVVMLSAVIASCSTPGSTPVATEPAATEAPQQVDTAVSPTEVPAEVTPMSLKVGLSTEPISMDPHVGNDSNTATALMLAFEGLLNVVDGKIEPGMAESYEVSEDGTVYTFHLRDAKWSDGKAVTASDFADTYKRMLTRKDAMDLAYLIFPIKNAQPINAGEKDVSELGVEVVDEKTLVITLEAPFPFMVTLFSSSAMYPIRNDLAEEYGNAYGSAADKIVSNGPYQLQEWAHNDRMIFVKNPDYWNADAIKIEEVTLLLVSDPNTMKNMYDTGEIYWMEVPSDMIAAYENTPEFTFYASGGVTFIVLSHNGASEKTAKITKNRNFLMALSSSIDREALVKAMFPTNKPFTGVINPVISDELGGQWGDTYDVTNVYHKVNADPEAAKAYIQAACDELGYASAADMPVFDYFTTSGDVQRTLAEYFQNTWEETLGIKIEIRQLEFAQYWENLYNQPYDIARTGWGPDYDDPFTYLDMWDSRGGWNKTGWVGEEYYLLITDANKEPDFKKRNDMFFEAEKILLTEAPIIPLYVSRGALVLSSEIKDVSINTFGARFDFRYATLEQ